MKVVHIQWIDSCTEIGWEEYKGDMEPEVTHTVGLLVNEGDFYTIVANSYDPATNEWNGRIAIPNISMLEPPNLLCQIKTKK